MKCLQADERLGSVLAPLYRIRSSDGENSTHFLTSEQNVFDWIIKRLTCSIFSFWKCINNVSFFNSECEIVLTVYLRFTVIIFCYIIWRSKWETSMIIFYSRNHYLSIPKVHPILLILMEVPSGKLDKCTFYSFCKWWYIWSHHKLYCEMHAILHHSIRTVYNNYPRMVVKLW